MSEAHGIRLGIFAKTFSRPDLEANLDAIAAYGLGEVQYNLACAGLPTVPERIDAAMVARIHAAFAARGLTMAALSGTYNIIHPDRAERIRSHERFAVLAAAARDLGTPMVTLCTGSRHPTNMWAAHPDNATAAAWDDMLESMGVLLRIAERTGIVLGVEPEVSNIVNDARAARRLIDAVGATHLRIVLDPANLFPAGSLPRMQAIIGEAFDLLGPHIGLAHAKDLSGDGEAGHEAAGTGRLDYNCYLGHLRRIGYRGALIMHGLSEEQVPFSSGFLRGKLAA